MAAVAKATRVIDTTGWLTREEACDFLCIGYATLLNWEKRGVLHPQKRQSHYSSAMIFVYDPRELSNVPTRMRNAKPGARLDDGEIEARAIRMLRDGRSIADLVLELRITFVRAETLRDQWLENGGVSLAIATVHKEELEEAIGPFETVAQLCARVRELAGRNSEKTATS